MKARRKERKFGKIMKEGKMKKGTKNNEKKDG